MKQVLILDAPLLFRELFKEKMNAAQIGVDIGTLARDGYTKLVSTVPSLVVIDSSNDLNGMMDFLEQKRSNPTTAHIPVIVTGDQLDREFLQTLPAYRVVRYFNKPVKFDFFFDFLGRCLKVPFTIDTTPCILETHLNNNIIFIELAQALNREKVSLLKYKISEMIDQNNLQSPKIVLMMTDLPLSFVDGSNLEYLLQNVTADARVKHQNIKVLSFDPFTRQLIAGHPEFANIQVVENLSSVLSSLVGNDGIMDVADTINDKILTATEDTSAGSVEMRFYSDSSMMSEQTPSDTGFTQIALVDDDPIILKMLSASFEAIQIKVDSFMSGAEFLAKTNQVHYDLVILDIFMPGLSGFDILNTLASRKFTGQVIVYSTASQREAVMQALSLGAKAYLVKPQKPEAIIQKAAEILNLPL